MDRSRRVGVIAPLSTLAAATGMLIAPAAIAQTPSFTLIGIPSLGAASRIQGLASDGRTAVGVLGSTSQGWFRWTADGGRNDLGPLNQEALGISGDGLSTVGVITGLNERAMKWTQSGGVQNLGTLPGFSQARAFDANYDGSIVVGWCETVPNGTPQAFRWTQSGGMVGLGVGTKALAISGNGSTIVGTTTISPLAMRWTQSGGVQILPSLGGSGPSNAAAVNFDGTLIVGSSGTFPRPTMWVNGVPTDFTQGSSTGLGLDPMAVNDTGSVVAGILGTQDFAAVWTAETGIMRLSDYLTANGVTLPPGVELLTCTAISADGKTFAGYIAGSQSLPIQGFVATISSPCPADLDNDGNLSNGATRDHAVTIDDLLYFLTAFESGNLAADLDNSTGTGVHDQAVDINDLLYFLTHFEAGC